LQGGNKRLWHQKPKLGILPRLADQSTNPRSLKSRIILRLVRGIPVAIAILILCAFSPRYWQAWAYLTLTIFLQIGIIVYFYRRDPEVLERRLLLGEKRRGQKFVIILLRWVWYLGVVVSLLDHQLGWSRDLFCPAPWWLTIVALLLITATQFLLAQVLIANRYAASIIQIESGQTLATTGPYRFVRHPMYFVGIVSTLATPPALGSFIGIPVTALFIPILVWRLLDEEKLLRQELPGYEVYCAQVRYRLFPGIW
jgi:protein-S-isoprenylcysteine O-methyltransferase Ste14